MALGSIQITTVTRTQDYTTIKHQEDNKAFLDQSNIGQQVEKDVRQRAKEVRNSDNSDWHQKKQDASEKGSNEYSGDGGRNRRRGKQPEQAGREEGPRFDMKI